MKQTENTFLQKKKIEDSKCVGKDEMETFRLIKLKENKHLKKTDDNMLDLS